MAIFAYKKPGETGPVSMGHFYNGRQIKVNDFLVLMNDCSAHCSFFSWKNRKGPPPQRPALNVLESMIRPLIINIMAT
jgi:hypothetical protein